MNDLSFDNWTTQLRKGLLELAVLNTIADAPLYGYEIVRHRAGSQPPATRRFVGSIREHLPR